MVVAAKGKLMPNPTLPKAANTAADGGTSFKIYSEPPDKIEHSKRGSADGDTSFKRKSVTFSKRRHLRSADILKSDFTNSKEIEGKICNSVKRNAERKVLADISNVRGSFLRRKVQDQSKSKSKSVGISSSISGTQSASSSFGRSYKANARTRMIKPAANHSKLEKVSSLSCNKEACSDDIVTQDDKHLTATNKHKQTSGLNRLPATRKYFSAGKQVHEADTCERKEKYTTKSGEEKENCGVAVKLKDGRNLASRVSYGQSRHMMASTDKHKIDAGVVSRRSTVYTIDARTSGHKHLPPIRKSLPVLKPANKTTTGRRKEIYSGNSEGQKGYGFPVKPKVYRKPASCASYVRSQQQKNDTSDGHAMASKHKHDRDVRQLARRSARIQITSKSRSSNKVASGSAISSMPKKVGKEEFSESSSSTCVGSLIPIEKQVEQVSAFSKSSVKTGECDALKRNRGRRKSFTSLLVSKLKEDLPSIYDDQNHLEVSEYVDDIYNYYWVVEAQNRTLKDYLESQSEITPQMRAVLINWLIEVHLKYDLMQETLFLMVTLLDQYLSLTHIKKNEMQLAGLTALFLASKYEDFWHPRIMDLISVSAESYTRDQMLGMESSFLKVLKFRLNAPTPYVFMLRFLKAAQSGAEESRKFEHLAFYLIELCLVEYEALQYKPSLLCASAIYVARCTMQMTPAWTLLLCKHSNYEESQLRQCAEMILKCHKAAETTLLKVTYEKFMRPEFSKVASINPLQMLPRRCK